MIERMLTDLLYWIMENCVLLLLIIFLSIQMDLLNSKIEGIEKHLGIKIKSKLFFWNKKI